MPSKRKRPLWLAIAIVVPDFALNAAFWGMPIAKTLYVHYNLEVLCIEYRVECPDEFPDSDTPEDPPPTTGPAPSKTPPPDAGTVDTAPPDAAVDSESVGPDADGGAAGGATATDPAENDPQPVTLPSFDSPAWWGRFEPRSPVTEWRPDGRDMLVLKDFTFLDRHGEAWLAPRGIDVDGASIPQFAWSYIGGPFEGLYRNASVIHDFFCCFKNRPWRRVHMVFYEAMRANAVDEFMARTMWSAVRYFGPRWHVIEGGDQQCVPVELPTLTRGDTDWFIRYRQWLEGSGRFLFIDDLERLAAACDAIADENLDAALTALLESEAPLSEEGAAVEFLQKVGCPAGDAAPVLDYLDSNGTPMAMLGDR